MKGLQIKITTETKNIYTITK